MLQVHAGALDHDTHEDALVAADVITRAIVTRAVVTRAVVTRAVVTRAVVTRAVVTRAVVTRQAGIPEEVLMAALLDDRAFHAQLRQASDMARSSSASASAWLACGPERPRSNGPSET